MDSYSRNSRGSVWDRIFKHNTVIEDIENNCVSMESFIPFVVSLQVAFIVLYPGNVDLFIQFGKLVDNVWLKNSYYIWDAEKEKIYLLLWDTDQAFGIEWIGEGVTYQFEPSVNTVRAEHTAILSSVPNISHLMSQRWKQLRGEILNYDNLLKVTEKYNSRIYDSGAVLRDKSTNGLFHNGEDSYEKLIVFIQEQLRLMDELYLEK